MLAERIIQLAIFAFVAVNAKFVKKVSENEYELNLNENGALYTQKVTLDEDHNLVITEVPAHHNRVAITYIYDSSNGLAMTVTPSSKDCEIERPFLAASTTTQKKNLDVAALDDSPEERLVVNSTTTTAYKLASIDGPQIDLECVPENFRKFVPEGFKIFLAHEVRLTKETFHQNGNNISQVFMTDPITQKKYEFGDDVAMFGEVFDILPECEAKQQRRVKRRSNTPSLTYDEKKGQCQDQSGNVMRCYGLKAVTCREGCDVQDTGYDCTDKSARCHYVLICPIVSEGNCIAHLLTDRFTCRQCCRVRECGDFLNKCKFTGGVKKDVCPPNGQGCPFWHVETSVDLDKTTDQHCSVDPSCDTVVSGDPKRIGSGVSCRKSDRSREFEKKYCCSSTDPTVQLLSDLPAC